MATKSLDERLEELYNRRDNVGQQFNAADIKTFVEGIRDAREKGGTQIKGATATELQPDETPTAEMTSDGTLVLGIPKGQKGDDGKQGDPGEQGKSAYQVWLEEGNEGTEADFLNSLKAHVSGFVPVAYDSTAAGKSIGQTFDFALENPVDGSMVLMPNAESSATGSIMFSVSVQDGVATYTRVGDVAIDTSNFLNTSSVDVTGLKNPTSSQVAKATDVQLMKQQLRGITLEETKVTTLTEVEKAINGTTGDLCTDSYGTHVVITLNGASRVRFLAAEVSGSSYPYGFCFYDSNGNVIANSMGLYNVNSDNNTRKAYEIVVDSPTDAITLKFSISSLNRNSKYCYLESGETIADMIPDVEEALTGDVQYLLPYNLLDVTKLESGKTISKTTGNVISTSTGDRAVTPFMRVIPGKKYYLFGGGYGTNGGSNHFGAVYDENKKFLRQVNLSSSSSGTLFEAQEGDCFVRHTINTTMACEAFLPALADGSSPNVNGITNKATNVQLPSAEVVKMAKTDSPLIITEANAPFFKPALSLTGSNRAVISSDALEANTGLSISGLDSIDGAIPYPKYIKGCHTISFKAYLSGQLGQNEGEYIRLGVNRASAEGKTIKITGTNITIERYSSGYHVCNNNPILHDLTIDGFVMVELTLHWKGGKIYLVTKTGSFVYEWSLSDLNSDAKLSGMDNEGIASVVSNVSMTNVELSQTSDRFMKPVWIFGDSYTSAFEYGTNGRWPYTMIHTLGIDGFLLDGHAGYESKDIYPDLVRALSYGTPKYLVWCLGLNDATRNALIYSNYASLVENACRKRGITLIYEKLPMRFDQNEAFRNRLRAFNQYIEGSGYRYIDFYGAVSADSDGHWYEDMLNSDNAHPTPLGAQVLASQILVDFPEIANYK